MNRKMRYLLEIANISEEKLNSRFERIDKVMKTISPGDKVYTGNCWGDIFERVVIRIVNKDEGIVELREEKSESTTIECVADFPLTMEEAKKLYH